MRCTSLVPCVVALLAICFSGCEMMSHSDNVAGVQLFEQGNYAAAMQKFQLAVQNDPNDADSYYNLGATYHRLGKLYKRPTDLQQAENNYHLCLDKNPDHKDCYRGLAVLLVEQNRSNDAFALVQQWGERNPSSPDAKVELARLFQEFGDKPAAMAHLQEAIALQPDNPRALAALGKLKEESGDPTQALAIYQRSLASNRFQPELQARVASLQSGPIAGGAPIGPDGTRMVTAPAAPLR
jgi:tetratricopeptide (TPR) repeat protein